jgi:hypothetical protein
MEKAPGTPPVIQRQPISRNATEGGHATLAVLVQAKTGVSCQWWRNGQVVTNNQRIAGATNFVLNIDPVLTNDTGSYVAVVSSGGGAVTSRVATLNVSRIGFGSTPTGATGAVLTLTGQVGDVYRIELSSNFGPWSTNGYATNFQGQARFTARWNNDGTFKQLRFTVDRILPVLYPGARRRTLRRSKLCRVPAWCARTES